MVTYFGTITLPNPINRCVEVKSFGYFEGGAFILNDESPEAFWMDTGEELTDAELEQEIIYLHRSMYVHEFIEEFTNWEIGG